MSRGYDAHDHDDRTWRAGHWDDRDRPEDRPRRRGLAARLFSLVKLALILTPPALFAASYLVTDCGARSGRGGVGELFRAGACARGEILAGALSLPDNLGLLRRVVD
ncbi:hypothetical protein [uncultured Methylobacterium sp.]|uniref:hypothetical protein n=1 Tax=uncultured Methylobacterium sp. TaxID=157278 RepID=UPI0035CC2871